MVAYPQPLYRLTPQEYLEREADATTKSEYHAGVLVAMAGASPEHNMITADIGGELYLALKERTDCQHFLNEMRVRVPACDKYYYPDITVVCGEPQYEEIAGVRSLLNPTLLIEVLSDSTEATDRGEKFLCYQTLDSFRAYLLISQNQPRAEVFQRVEAGWLYQPFLGLDNQVPLEGFGFSLKLADIYRRLSFAALPPDAPAYIPGADDDQDEE